MELISKLLGFLENIIPSTQLSHQGDVTLDLWHPGSEMIQGTKNTLEVFLALDDVVHDDVLKLPPMELFGFNVGEWIVSDSKELEGASKKYTVMIFK